MSLWHYDLPYPLKNQSLVLELDIDRNDMNDNSQSTVMNS